MSHAPRLLMSADAIASRRDAAAGPLAPLAASLAADLATARERVTHEGVPFVPPEKARMTRVGGRCATDGALLAFDPFDPHHHACPICGRVYAGDEHYRWWIFWYQLWLAERAVHGATLALVAGDAAAGDFARAILRAYADRYLTYANRDNVLGPTRPFFSTYLESIWLLQLCVALDLIEAAAPGDPLGGIVRDRVVAPSRALIAEYDERRSNRQVWNAAALAAAARLLGDDAGAERAFAGESGVVSHLRDGLLADGTWYEGENYHQFAHRGLWYGVTLAARAGHEIDAGLRARFARGFVAPFLTALPDLTLPARRDSQWAISLRQWRWAESCELGLGCTERGGEHEARLAGTLAALYAPDAPVPRRDTGRWRTAAESERNEPPTRLTRADLGWRSLLHAPAVLLHAERWAPASVLLPAQGIAVFRRRSPALWAALDYGTSGGGHGHPDRLNVLLADGPRRWLDDMGTGSYVERALHWYRSTLAHNAPLVDGRSQPRADGWLDAHDERGDWGWAVAGADIAPDVVAHRALVVGRDYVIDHLEWSAPRDVTLDLPLHVDADVRAPAEWTAAALSGAGGVEDGFDFLEEVEATAFAAGAVVPLEAGASRAILATPAAEHQEAPPLRAWVSCATPAVWFRATAPSSPGRGARRFHVVRAHAARGSITAVWDPAARLAGVTIDEDQLTVRRADGGEDVHVMEPDAWHVAEVRGGATRALTLLGRRPPQPPAAGGRAAPEPAIVSLPLRGVTLGEGHYRRSELSWHDAGRPTARVDVRRDGDGLRVDVAVVTPEPTFVPAGLDNPLDNERPETNGHGIQLYLRRGDDALGWLLVPDEARAPEVRVIALSPAAGQVAPRAWWARTANGWALTATIPAAALGDEPVVGFDLIVNETTPDRERRRGQLVLSGARGEFVYLQGDRHDPARFLALRVVP